LAGGAVVVTLSARGTDDTGSPGPEAAAHALCIRLADHTVALAATEAGRAGGAKAPASRPARDECAGAQIGLRRAALCVVGATALLLSSRSSSGCPCGRSHRRQRSRRRCA
jgi:hypothetical protein